MSGGGSEVRAGGASVMMQKGKTAAVVPLVVDAMQPESWLHQAKLSPLLMFMLLLLRNQYCDPRAQIHVPFIRQSNRLSVRVQQSTAPIPTSLHFFSASVAATQTV